MWWCFTELEQLEGRDHGCQTQPVYATVARSNRTESCELSKTTRPVNQEPNQFRQQLVVISGGRGGAPTLAFYTLPQKLCSNHQTHAAKRSTRKLVFGRPMQFLSLRWYSCLHLPTATLSLSPPRELLPITRSAALSQRPAHYKDAR